MKNSQFAGLQSQCARRDPFERGAAAMGRRSRKEKPGHGGRVPSRSVKVAEAATLRGINTLADDEYLATTGAGGPVEVIVHAGADDVDSGWKLWPMVPARSRSVELLEGST